MELEYITDIDFAEENLKVDEYEIPEDTPLTGNSQGTEESDNTNSVSTSQNNKSELKPGDKFYGTIPTNINGKNQKITDVFTVVSNDGKTMEVTDSKGNSHKTNPNRVEQKDLSKIMEQKRKEQEELAQKLKEDHERRMEEKRQREEFEAKAITFETLEPEVRLETLIDCGFNNIWLVGPAGSGKSTMVRNVSNKLDVPYLCISCGIGTSAAEFVGYKYPSREATKFSEFYTKPSIILIDEITALDAAVAQVLNAALANGEIETTTGLVHRHPECIIVATSNTFGTGANRQYVANNQLDASTIDRFVGATIEIDYSEEFESQYDDEVVDYVYDLRYCIKQNEMRRVASTRMIQAGQKLKSKFIREWKDVLIKNWSKSEKEILKEYIKSKELLSDNAIKKSRRKPKVINANVEVAPSSSSTSPNIETVCLN